MSEERKRYEGTITIPGSKSQTIRASLIAFLARGKSIIHNPLLSGDTLSCLECLKKLGVIVRYEKETMVIDSSSLTLDKKDYLLDVGNSGTTLALLSATLSVFPQQFTFTGDEQIKSRPFGPLLKSLEDLGCIVESNNGYPPFKIIGPLKGGRTTLECKTSQYLSGLLLSSPMAKENTTIDCSLLYEKPYVAMTLEWLNKEGIKYSISDDMIHSFVPGGQKYHPFEETIEGDFSSATFFMVLACLHKSKIELKNLRRNTTQGDKRVLDILEKMGAEVKWKDDSTVTLKGPERLRGGVYDINDIPDALPSLAVLASFIEGETSFINVEQARIKETDRIKAMREELEKLDVDITELPDGLTIRGRSHINGGSVSGHKDHRIIMALSICGTKTDSPLIIDDTRAVDVTFPNFFSLLKSLE